MKKNVIRVLSIIPIAFTHVLAQTIGSDVTMYNREFNDAAVLIIVVLGVTLIPLALAGNKKKGKEDKLTFEKQEEGPNHNYDEMVQRYFPSYTEEELKNKLYEIFVSVETLLNESKEKELEDYCSNELYESYIIDLKHEKDSHCKEINCDINLVSSTIRNIERINDRIIVDYYLCVDMKKYVEDTNTKELVRGDNMKTTKYEYDLEYIMDVVKEKSDTCPNCGAVMKGRECGFCHTFIVNPTKKELVLNKVDLITK